MTSDCANAIAEAAKLILASKHAIAFTGAGISLESGIPTFRGSDGDNIWNKYDPNDIEIDHFNANPKKSWATIKACFYYFMADRDIKPNKGHKVLAELEQKGILKCIVTQNIDGLHQAAGSKNVYEFHGTTTSVSCQKCGHKYSASKVDFSQDVPTCPLCGGILKPDFVFFGEGIPSDALDGSFAEANAADLCIVVGTSGVVMPAAMIPVCVKRNGGKVIEISPERTEITRLADVFIQAGAVDAFSAIEKAIWPDKQ